MRRNILLSLAGVIAGFFIGFFLANKTWKPPQFAGMNAGAQAGAARPLDPAETGGQLPPDHPSLDAAGDGAPGGGAASSQQAQAAMDAADRNPRNFDAQMTAAATFYQAGALERAAVYLDRALAIMPDNADALTAMGDTKYDLGNYVEAATYYERSLRVRPDAPDVRTDLGNTYFQRTPPDYDRAIAEYRKTLELDPKHEKTLQNLAAAALRKGDKTTAREALDRLAAANPANPAVNSLRSTLDAQ
ncbi:MAG TPA: tetratricopeptide repeat protein [Pyrinomonadaceae bacterium]|jgi:tetratricopeptide (TPR) repeat protein